MVTNDKKPKLFWAKIGVSKKLWFVLFNAVTIVYLMLVGKLHLEMDSLLSCGAALLLINVVVFISAKNFPDWK